MIEQYFLWIESTIQNFPHLSYSLSKKAYNSKQGYISGYIVFEDNSRLDFIEVKDVEMSNKIKYRYQYMDLEKQFIFRYDNAPHHSEIQTFPHHVHWPGQLGESSEPALFDVLLEIARIIHE